MFACIPWEMGAANGQKIWQHPSGPSPRDRSREGGKKRERKIEGGTMRTKLLLWALKEALPPSPDTPRAGRGRRRWELPRPSLRLRMDPLGCQRCMSSSLHPSVSSRGRVRILEQRSRAEHNWDFVMSLKSSWYYSSEWLDGFIRQGGEEGEGEGVYQKSCMWVWWWDVQPLGWSENLHSLNMV